VDPVLLLTIAWRESRFDPAARNPRSSAHGLLQFTSSTWLALVKDFGPEHALSAYAGSIRKMPSGELVVPERATLHSILMLRDDPRVSALLGAESLRRQGETMAQQLGRAPSLADLYLAHTLGPAGATRMAAALARHPRASAADIVGADALRNAGLLASDGRALSVAETCHAVTALLNQQRARLQPLLEASARAPAGDGVEIAEAP
jgi:Transglycosylase SLT domain